MLKAVILIGGPQKGMRFCPLSLDITKHLFSVAGLPIIQHLIEACANVTSLNEILLIGNYPISQIQQFVIDMQNQYDVNIRYLQELTDLGTAGGMYHFRDQIRWGNPDAFFVMNGDICADFPLDQLYEFHKSKNNALISIMGTKVTRTQSIHYGCMVTTKTTGEVTHYIEKPSSYVSTLINCGVYVCSLAIFQTMACTVFNQKQLECYKQANDKDASHIQFEQEILAPLAGTGKLYALKLYRTQKPERLARSQTDNEESDDNNRIQCTIIPDVCIHTSATVHPTADLGPNVSISTGKELLKPLQDVRTTPSKQSSHSRSSAKENSEAGPNSSKRKRSVTDTIDIVSKRLCKDSELPSGLQDEFRQDLPDELLNPCQTKQYRSHLPHALIRLMYQLDLSVLCSLRKLKYGHKYPSLSLAFEDYEIDKFNNIVLRHENKSIHLQIENVDKYYIDNNISYAKLFTKERRSIFFINDYFNSFVTHLISKSDNLLNDIEYLIIYTNSGLNLTEEDKLKQERFRNFYPFKFDRINIEKCDILQNFLSTGDNIQGRAFYQFLQDETMREELLKRLAFSPTMQKVIKARKLSQEFENKIKEAFLDKLVFAVNQPSRDEMNSIVRSEIEKNSEVQDNYIALQEKVLCGLTAPEKHKKLGNYIYGITYQFNLLMSFLHFMFLHKNMLSVNFEAKSGGISNDITINYRGRITHVKAYTTNSSIGYSQLFPFKLGKRDMFSINKHFTFFIEGLKNDIRYFIIYTDAGVDLTEEKVLKKGRSKDFYPLKFNSIDIQKKKYKILRNCSCINENNLYQFAQEETRDKLMSLLKLPPSMQKKKEEGRLSGENEKEIKNKFLDKLILAVNQPNRGNMNSVIRNEIDTSNVPYNYEKLQEIALRWSESHEFGCITKEIMEKLLEDINKNRSSYQEIQNKNIDEEIKFAGSVVGRDGTFAFDQFLDFLIKGEGKKYLEVLRKKRISLTSTSSILHGAGTNAAKAFKDLYDLWFDAEENKTQHLKTLEDEGISLANVSSILHGARANAAKAFKDLYDLWFDEKGNKKHFLKTLEKEGINLPNMTSILSGTGANVAKSFKDLHDLWFNADGNKTQYLKTLEEEGINLANISSILHGVGTNAAKVFKDLYDLWFDAKGNKTQYLKILEKEGINLASMSSILHRARANAVKAFLDLYNLWFNTDGNETLYLKTLEKEGINLVNISSILGGAGTNAVKAFKDLYGLWFNAGGSKTQYLKSLENEGIDLANMSSILSGAGANAAKAFRDLYNLWFDARGNKTQYLKTLKKEKINLTNVSSILHGTGANAERAFKDLYDLWFNAQGNKTQYLKTLEEEEISLAIVSSILHGARANAANAFKDLYGLWFTAEGNKTQYVKTLEKEGINLANISSILGRTGNNAATAFKDLYDLWFDEQGNKKQYLKHFIKEREEEKGFTLYNLSSILGGAGAKFRDAFEKLHNVCFNDKGKRTKLLDDFYKAGFRPSNLSCILCKTGVHASSILKRLHSVCFNDKRKRTKLLDDFYKAGFRPCYLCSILSGAADKIENFHNFCFTGEKKSYLNNFFREGFTPKNLSNIFHGARDNVCSVLKDFYGVCFNDKGKRTKLLDDFCKAGFRPSDLARVLSMAGTNATSILINFHKLCFNKDNYLNHFFAEEELFTHKNLSKVLHGVGIHICPIFKKLHDLCFGKEGNKTNYLKDLIKNNPSNKILDIVYEKVRKAPTTFLDDTLLQQQNVSGIEKNNIGEYS